MKKNLTKTEQKIIEGICKHPSIKHKSDDYLIAILSDTYQRLYRRPFNE